MSEPLLTIITPVRNGADVLEKTIQSVLSQDAALYEYIVQDGASTDGTQAILKAHMPRLVFVSEPDGGVYDAMNRALARARGQFIYFLGAGDVLKPGILTEVAAVIQQDASAPNRDDRPLMLYGNVFSEGHRRVYNGPYTRWKLSRINLCHQAIFAERRCFAELGPFDLRFPIMADYAWNIRAFGADRIRKQYTTLVIADFAAGGLSVQWPDAAFIAARSRLIRGNLGVGPTLFDTLASLVPPGVKEARYRAFQRVRLALGLPVKH